MLKIKDAKGEVVGILKDEDSEPTMKKKKKPLKEVEENKEGESNADESDANVR